MAGFDGIGFHALGELFDYFPPLVYLPVSKIK